jgi:hypothetical protein
MGGCLCSVRYRRLDGQTPAALSVWDHVIGHEAVALLTVFPEHHAGYTQVKRREKRQLGIIQLQAWTGRVELTSALRARADRPVRGRAGSGRL